MPQPGEEKLNVRNLLIGFLLFLLAALWQISATAPAWAIPAVGLAMVCTAWVLGVRLIAPILVKLAVRRHGVRPPVHGPPVVSETWETDTPRLNRTRVGLFTLLLVGISLLIAPSVSLAQTTIVNENFDAPTAPALPTDGLLTYTNASSLVTSTTNALSSPNSAWANTTTAQNVSTVSTDGVNGDSDASGAILFAAVGGSDKAEVILRSTSSSNTSNQYYALLEGNGSVQLYKRVSGTSTQLGSTITVSGGLVANTWYILNITGIGTTLSVSLVQNSTGKYLNSSGSFVSGSTTCISLSDSTYTGTAGYSGFIISNSSAGRVYVDNFVFRSDAALAVTQPVPTAITATSVTMSATASGGAGGYTYQWYRSNVANFTPGGGNILSGATSASVTDSTISSGTIYYYKLVVTDTASNTATSAATQGYIGTAPNTLQVVAFGDSIGNKPTYPTDTPIVYFSNFVQQLGGFRSINVQNCHINGSDTSTGAGGWQTTATSTASTGGNTNLSGYGGNYLTALLSYVAATFPSGTVYFMCELGRNDGNSGTTATQFATNIASIISTITGTSARYVVVYNDPIADEVNATSQWTDAKTDLVVSYQAKIAAAVNGTTVLQGDTGLGLLAMASNYPIYLNTTDYIHPTDLGAQVLGVIWAHAFLKAVNPSIWGTSGLIGRGRTLK